MRIPSNIWKSPVIQKRLFQEACYETGSSFYWFNVPEGDTRKGSIELRNYRSSVLGIDDPHIMQMNFAHDIRKILQKEISHGGIWIVGWVTPPSVLSTDNTWKQLVMLWLDEDADPHFSIEDSHHQFIQMLQNGIPHYVSRAEEGFLMWNKDYGRRALKDDFGFKDDELHKKALSSLD